MKHISIIVPAGEAVLSSIIGPYKIFNKVNDYLKQTGEYKEDYFKVELVGLKAETNLYDGAFNVKPHKTINDIDETDLIIVTTIIGNIEEELQRNAAFIPWILSQRRKFNTEVASLCVGAFLLAETGLLDGKSCATHWMVADQFRAAYPQINLLPEKVITEDDGIYSSGGSYSFLNLILHLVEKYSGRTTALWCAKLFEIDFDRDNQNQFVIFNGQKDHEDDVIKKAQVYIENNFEGKISVEGLATMLALSRRNFVRRFKKATANTPIEYIQRVKIEAAKKSLESSNKNIAAVMYSVGYNDTKAFRNTFRKYTGLSPLEYKNKYNREAELVL